MTMSHDRYQEDLTLTVEDFAGCGWKAALAEAAREDYYSMSEAFSSAAKQAIDEDRQAHGKALWLLADACSMTLSPDSINEPFKPLWVMDDRRSSIPDDLPEADIAFFAQIVDEIDDLWLKARLADLVWLKQRSRDHRFALIAIDSYRSIPLGAETSVRDRLACWQRAISLARMLGAGAGGRLVEIETALLEALESATKQDGFLGHRLADLLKTKGLGRKHSTTIATKLESLARKFEEANDFLNACDYFRASADWFEASGDDAKSVEMTVAEAEGQAKEASARISSDQPSHMAAAGFFEQAIQTYRTIPRPERASHQVDERIAELRAKLSESGEKSLDEMGVITSPGVDISQIVEDARNAVSGKEPIETLKTFANLDSGANVEELRDDAIKRLSRYPLQAFCSTMLMSPDGRVVGKRPGMGSSLNTMRRLFIPIWSRNTTCLSVLLSRPAFGPL